MGLSRPPIERLMEKVAKRDNGCWEWTSYIEKNGYTKLWVDRRAVLAHRWSYEYHVGPIPEGLQIDHLCRVRHCVNPEHLEAVTPAENTRRSTGPEVRREWGRNNTHCPKGHPYTEENTYRDSAGRSCLTCKKAAARRWYEQNRALTIQRAREWHESNPDRARELGREAQRRQRAKKKEAA